MMIRTTHRNCTFCEAICGVVVKTEGDRVLSVRGDDADPLSKGYICPKAHALIGVQEDPDRLRRPQRRTKGGWREVSWQEALDETADRLGEIRERHGADANALYLGNPTANDGPTILYLGAFQKALGSRRRYNSSSVDQLPKMLVNACLIGGNATLSVPDVDRTSHFLILGANPVVSNGSLMTAPGMKKRLAAIRARGGKVVLVDPRRSETAAHVDEHLPIRPGSDPLFLFAIVHTLFAENLVRPGRLAAIVDGIDRVRELANDFPPEAVAEATAIDAETIRRVAREFAAAPSAVCYGRVGASVQDFGTLANWLCDVVNLLTGNLDRPGGAMFATPAVPFDFGDTACEIGTLPYGRWKSAVRGLPEFGGDLPAVTIAEDIEVDSPERIRGMVTHAGNPVLSNPDGARLARALDSLDFMVSVDIYRNETTRHAHLILPPTWSLERDNYDMFFYVWSTRNVTKYSPAALPKPEGALHGWEIFLGLAGRLLGMREAGAHAVDDALLDGLLGQLGLDAGMIRPLLGEGYGPDRMIDLLLRVGPYGDAFGERPDGWNLERVRAHPHGVDLGPLRESLPGHLTTPSGRIDLAHEVIVADVPRLRERLRSERRDEMLLIGRRDLRSKNSWLHNVPAMVKGADRCTLLVHPDDAARIGLVDGGKASLRTETAELVAPVEVSDEMMRGVVCLPHGWGHALEGVELRVAAEKPGVPTNFLLSSGRVDVPSGNAVLTAVPVEVRAA